MTQKVQPESDRLALSPCSLRRSTGESKISVRSFAWHDLLTFYRSRRQILITDSAQALTHGSPVGPMAILARINPTVENYTSISPAENGSPAIIGHVQYLSGDRSARLAYLMPADALGNDGLIALLEKLAVRAGEWGAFHLVAEIDETSPAFDTMRRSGFTVYAWQRIWQFRAAKPNNHHAPGNGWELATRIDENAIRNLYQSLVPPLVQSAEPLTARRLQGWVYRHNGEVLAYVEAIYGPQGIYLQPLIHPAVENLNQVVNELLRRQPNRLNRPVYMAVRSYQAWLETVVRDLECQVGPRQGLMVKHLVSHLRAAEKVRHSVLEKYTTEPSAPMVHNAAAEQVKKQTLSS